jgi:protein SYS1
MARRRRPPRPGALTELPPLKIIRDIALLQSLYYACASFIIIFTVVVLGQKFSVDLIFSWKSIRGDTTLGWMMGFVWMFNSFLGYGSFPTQSLSARALDFLPFCIRAFITSTRAKVISI